MTGEYPLENPTTLLSPSLLIFRTLVRRNLDAMLRLARSPERLRPHAKTHKMPALIRLTEELGIRKHKCATIAEAEMIAAAGGSDVLLAYPLVGPSVGRLLRLIRAYPETTFRVTVDDPAAVRALSDGLGGHDPRVPVLLDLDVGMGRTGIAPGAAAEELYALVSTRPGLEPDGLHAYDGHIKQSDVNARRKEVAAGHEQVFSLRDRLLKRGLPVPRIVLGGTPSFPMHAACEEPATECSPGTCALHDAGYATKFPDLPFVPAALLFTRVVSRPRPGRLCLDLGHKAVAADPVGARLTLLGVPDATLGGQSEEHLVVDTPHADRYPIGTPLLAIPTHICPTCALHRRAYVIEDGKAVDEWEVTARDRVIRI